MKATIAVLPGDGIGPDVTAEACRVLTAVAKLANHEFTFQEGLIGGIAIDHYGQPLPERTRNLVQDADAVLLGAVGGPRWDREAESSGAPRPEAGLLELRRSMGLYANLRPVKPYPELAHASPVKADILQGVDLLVVRELTGGLYFGARGRTADTAYDTCSYSRLEIVRVAQLAFQQARARRRRLTSVDKANVLDTSRLWRNTVQQVAHDYPDVALDHLLVDTAAMQLMQTPGRFDVILTENMFGDILTDEASVLAGSMGIVPSASLGNSQTGVYEPIHGSAPSLSGQQRANPLGAILSAAMLLRHSLDLPEEAQMIEQAVAYTVKHGQVTEELTRAGQRALSTSEVGDAVVTALGLQLCKQSDIFFV